MNSRKMTVAVVGLGRFGYFWAKLLKSQFNVIAWSRNPERKVPKGVKKVSFEALFDADALFLCNAISSMEAVATLLAPHLKPHTVVLDTCSVKVYPLTVLKEQLPKGQPLIGTHPMIGPDSGRGGVKDKPLVITPVQQSDEQLTFWKKTFTKMGFKLVQLSAEEHDREAAYTQGITHFVGRVLGEMHLTPSEMATNGYQSLLNIVVQTCNDSWQLFEDLQYYNPYTDLMRKDLNQVLETMLKRFNRIDNIDDSGELSDR